MSDHVETLKDILSYYPLMPVKYHDAIHAVLEDLDEAQSDKVALADTASDCIWGGECGWEKKGIKHLRDSLYAWRKRCMEENELLEDENRELARMHNVLEDRIEAALERYDNRSAGEDRYLGMDMSDALRGEDG